MLLRSFGVVASLVVGVSLVACSTTVERSGFTTTTNPTTPAKKGASSSSGGFGNPTTSAANQTPTSDCGINNTGTGDPTKDYDGDGFTLADDCNECNTGINAGAMDVPGNGIDEDCSGTPDDEAVTCDSGIDVTTGDPFAGAAALGLCRKADPNGKSWGVLSAKWVKPDGKSLSDARGYGVLAGIGNNTPHEGAAVLALSSGMARGPNDDGYSALMSTDKGYTSGTPDGYPKESPACPGVTSGTAHDGAALQVKIRVPSNAQSFTYDHFFLTVEFPQYICSEYNDFFVTMMDPIPNGLPDGNIAFDQDTNPISVNNSLFQVCSPGTYGGGGGGIFGIGGTGSQKDFSCPLGTDALNGTGFENHGGTGWLTTTAPVTGAQEITLTFAIWDSGDGRLDSTVVVDNFKWSLETSDTTNTQPTGVK